MTAADDRFNELAFKHWETLTTTLGPPRYRVRGQGRSWAPPKPKTEPTLADELAQCWYEALAEVEEIAAHGGLLP